MSDLPPHDLPRSPIAAPDPDPDEQTGAAADAPAPAAAERRLRPRSLPRPGLDPAAALEEHAAAMFGSARRVSLCDDDAHDAVQAAAERFLRNVHRVEPETVAGWLITVSRREGLRVRERRVRTSAIDEDDRRLVHAGDGPEDLVARGEDIELAREALARLKKQERLALWMQAEGRSYDEIAEELSWSRTKVNRNITEGRARLRKALAAIALGEGCGAAGPRIDRLAGGGATAEDLRELRPHLRRCAACRGRLRRARGGRWSVVPPLLLAWLPWAGRGAGTAPPVRTRVTELVADRLALLLPATSGAVTEAGLVLTSGLAAAALGAGVLAGGGAADEPSGPTTERRAATASAALRTAPAAAPRSPVASARVTLASTTSAWSAASDRASARTAARRRAALRERRRAAARRKAAQRRRDAARGSSPTSGAGGTLTAPQGPAVPAPVPASGGTGSTSSGSAGGRSSSGSGSSSDGGGSAADEFGFE